MTRSPRLPDRPGTRRTGDRAPAPGRLVLVQDLVNTADLEAGRDRLRTVDELEVFCVDHGIGEIGAGTADVTAARRLREALRDACAAHAGAAVPAASLAVLDGLLRRAPLVLTIDAAGRAAALPRPGSPGVDALAGHLAAAILAAETGGTWLRLKACGSPPCRWVYYDRSPGARGRWCSMAACGARAKMRTYRARRSPTA